MTINTNWIAPMLEVGSRVFIQLLLTHWQIIALLVAVAIFRVVFRILVRRIVMQRSRAVTRRDIELHQMAQSYNAYLASINRERYPNEPLPSPDYLKDYFPHVKQ